ncbi:MAG: aminomethyl-transferring glycine dehydrogenase subunit GcvPB [candidate division KSB1 bacterium]|nr:aminomethyl-transferring glycine dehydrogenase subunit GcvPB [candidate division KSB1 bacterium]
MSGRQLEPLIFEISRPGKCGVKLPEVDVPHADVEDLLPADALRARPAGLPEVSEPEVVRHFVRLSALNYHLDKGLYPLGSCTMKYNPKINEAMARLPGFAHLHPFQPSQTVQGALQLMAELGAYLCEIAGMAGVTLQPAAGAQGELTGLMMIRAYHERQGKPRRFVLIPDSAHGTNPASVTISGYEAIQIRSNENGRVDLEDLRAKANEETAALMLTNPNTLGIFEVDADAIRQILDSVGALFYMDGANLNALLGIVRPGDLGVDVVHFNLHKTFSTPHGGGGPGAGPVGVSERLLPFLPKPVVRKDGDGYRFDWERPDSIGRVLAFWGHFLVMVRAYTYIRMLGPEGLRAVSEAAVLNANYLLARLRQVYDLPYAERPMHEFVLSGDRQKTKGVRTLDIAKRLLDLGLHAPTVYFPLIVHEALMIEPTETESKSSLDAFAEAMLQIAREAEESPELLRSAPTTTPVGRLDEAKASRELNVRYVRA